MFFTVTSILSCYGYNYLDTLENIEEFEEFKFEESKEDENPQDFVPKDNSATMKDIVYEKLMTKAQDIEKEAAEELDYSSALNEPDKNHGKVFKIQGLVIKFWPVKFADKTLYSALIFTKDHQPLLVHILKKPDVIYLKEDIVQGKAFFVKTIDFQTTIGDMKIPFFMAKTVAKYF